MTIQFGDTVVICAPGKPFRDGVRNMPNRWVDTEYTDRLELKSASDRTLGVGVLRVGDDNNLMVLTAATLMKVAIDGEKVVQFQAA